MDPDNELYKDIFDNSAAAIAILEKDFTISHVNKAFCILSGYSEKELIGFDWTTKMPQQELGRLKEYNQQRYKDINNVPKEYETSYVTKTGKLGYCIISAAIIGKSKKTIVIIIDITEIKDKERRLSEEGDKYRSLIEHANDIIYSVSSDGSFEYVSPNWQDKLGHSVHEIIGKPVQYYIHPDDFPIVQQGLDRIFESGDDEPSIEFRIRNKRNQWQWFESSLSRSPDSVENEKLVIGIAHDITKRKNAEDIINETLQKLETAHRIARLGPWSYDVNENLFYFNDTFYSIFRTCTKEVGSATMRPEEYADRFVHPDDRYLIKEELKNALKTNPSSFTRQLEHRIIYSDGEPGYIQVVITVERNKNGKIEKIFGINQDITIRKRYEEELQAGKEALQELNVKKDKFFSIIAHDLRNPISSIIEISNLLVEKTKDKAPEDVYTIAEMLHQSSTRVMDLLSNLLEWSMNELENTAIEPEEFDICGTISETIKLLKLQTVKKDISIQFDHSNPIILNTDLSMVKTILRNLISNAVKFSYPSSEIQISAEERDDNAFIVVKDHGVGMDAATVENLFRIDISQSTPGTASERGTGLGLVLCKEFTDKLGGKIYAESKVNNGSTFYITLPLKSI